MASVDSVDPNAYGLDNRLTKATLEDGREVLLRQSVSAEEGHERVAADY